jgi:hypothetical protein
VLYRERLLKASITELWRNVQPEHLSEEYYFRVIYQKLSRLAISRSHSDSIARIEAKALVYKTRAEEGAASYEDGTTPQIEDEVTISSTGSV